MHDGIRKLRHPLAIANYDSVLRLHKVPSLFCASRFYSFSAFGGSVKFLVDVVLLVETEIFV
jgi:hypothetical protein